MDTRHWPCGSCGAKLEYAPGQDALHCPYCGATTSLEAASDQQIDEARAEQDYEQWLVRLADGGDALAACNEVRCPACGAETQFDAHVAADRCPFCAAPLESTQAHEVRKIRPQALIPFRVTEREAKDHFRKWIQGLWFAPNALSRALREDSRMRGCLLPHWTYDAATDTPYTGMRGDHYYETETYTENGQRRTRQVQKTRWSPAFGRVRVMFDDVLVSGTPTIEQGHLDALAPWNLQEIQPFRPELAAGFLVEIYRTDLPSAFGTARGIMVDEIRSEICRDIGGDEQRITTMSPEFARVTWKHLLLPVWVSSYHYGGKCWRFLVNGQSGAVHGERPWSIPKIVAAVLLALAVIGGIVVMMQEGA